MGRNTLAKVDYAEAQRLIDAGATVLSIARRFDVSPQAVYDAIKRDRLSRPAAPAAAISG